MLEKRNGHDFEVFNCGTSGWDTSQSLAAWRNKQSSYVKSMCRLLVEAHAVPAG